MLGTFLCSYATTLLECGAATVRIEKNVGRMAEAYGGDAEVSIYPRHVEVVLKDDESGTTEVCSKAHQRQRNKLFHRQRTEQTQLELP